MEDHGEYVNEGAALKVVDKSRPDCIPDEDTEEKMQKEN